MIKNKLLTMVYAIGVSCFLTACSGIHMSAEPAVSQVVEEKAVEEISSADSEQSAEQEKNISAQAIETSFESTENDVSESATEPLSETSSTLTLIMVGDMLMHTPVENSALQEDGSYDYSTIFMHTKELIQEADLAIVNEEVIIGGEVLGVSGYPAFNAPYELGHELVETGFDVICHGTNHALDKGKKGLMNCITFWDENYPEIAVLGIHANQESQDEIYLHEQNGMTVAILNYSYGTNGIPLPSDMPYAVDLLEEERVIEDIKQAEELADFTIVCPHWGTEYLLETDSQQKKWTNIFLEYGVDLVLGTHPHVIEPVEWVVDEETGHEMLVYYSLGNFVNWTSSSGDGIANRMVGGMAQVTLEMDENQQVHIKEYDVEPLVSHLQQGVNGVTVYPLSDYTKELAARNEILKQDAAFSLEYCEALCENVWGQ